MSSSVSGTQLVFRHATERYGFRLLSRNRARDLRVSVQPPFSTRCDTRQPTEQSHYGSVVLVVTELQRCSAIGININAKKSRAKRETHS